MLGVGTWHRGEQHHRWRGSGRSTRSKIADAANLHGHDAVLGGSSGSVGTRQHHRHARLSSTSGDALHGRVAARAIVIAEVLQRTVAAVSVVEQLLSAARAIVAPKLSMLCRWSNGIGVSSNGGVCLACTDMPDGMAAA